MDKFKLQIQQKLIANILVDECAQSEYLLFRDAWCVQERVIRFTTLFSENTWLYLMAVKADGKRVILSCMKSIMT